MCFLSYGYLKCMEILESQKLSFSLFPRLKELNNAHLFSDFFGQYTEQTICWISFRKFSDVLPACTYTSAIGNLWRIWFGNNILISFPQVDLFGSKSSNY